MSRVSPGEPEGPGPVTGVPWSPAFSSCLSPANPPAC
jgi:hypothetical protein